MMYNFVWLEDQEVHLHRFLWRDTEEEDIGEYAITQVNIGDKPAGCIAQVAMQEAANLLMFRHLAEEHRVLEQNAYVEDIQTSYDDLRQLKQITAKVEGIPEAGGFHMKPWVYSGQSGRSELRKQRRTASEMEATQVMALLNQLSEQSNKALGLLQKEEENETRRNLAREEVRAHVPDPLTRR